MHSNSSNSYEISAAEAEVYDRQIRLWGLDAQNRLRNSSVLLVGLDGLGAEVAKNLMLSGLKSLTIMDNQLVTENDFFSQFLLSPNSISQNRAEASKHKTQILNPMVDLIILTDDLNLKTEEFYKTFNLIILIGQKYDLINKVNRICRNLGIKFQAGGVYGWIGYAFFDFNNHVFLLPKPKTHTALELDDLDDSEPSTKKRKFESNKPTTLTVDDDEDQKIQQKVFFNSFESTFNINWNVKQISRRSRTTVPLSYFIIKSLLRITNKKNDVDVDELFEAYKEELCNANKNNLLKPLNTEALSFFTHCQLSPVCAIVGSLIGQEAIKALSQNDAPLKNVFFYSAIDTSGIICELPPKIF